MSGQKGGRRNETIGIHYSDSGGTNNLNFTFITSMSTPSPRITKDLYIDLLEPELAFSADGSKFAIMMNSNRVSVWDI